MVKIITSSRETSMFSENDKGYCRGHFAYCVAGKYVGLALLLKPAAPPVQVGVKGDVSEASAGFDTTSPIADMGDMTNAYVSASTAALDTITIPHQNATSIANTIESKNSKAPHSYATSMTLPADDANRSSYTASIATEADNSNVKLNVNLNLNVSSPVVYDHSTDPKPGVDASDNSDCVEE
ncbi:hypothetical protein DFH28DRAFT_1148058 [Melampsora americana]|nr:hypothetical protein DFH28DRAFT_1148058 [Melampsora americana]